MPAYRSQATRFSSSVFFQGGNFNSGFASTTLKPALRSDGPPQGEK
jgi:hypothetical protein